MSLTETSIVVSVRKLKDGGVEVLNTSGGFRKGAILTASAYEAYPPGSLLDLCFQLVDGIWKLWWIFVTGMELDEGLRFSADKMVFNPKLKLLPQEEEMSLVNGYSINHESRLVFSTALELSKKKPERAVKIMIVGPSGYGKTTLPRLFAEKAEMKYMRMNCASIRDPEEWFGFREAKDGSTVFIRSQLITRLEEGNLVLVLDEFNRLEPWLTNTLFPLLDDDGRTVVHDEVFAIGPNVIVVATINQGYKYTGTFELDEALSNRFELFLEVGPLNTTQEQDVLVTQQNITASEAKQIVKMANMMREKEVNCSTRSTLAVAALVSSGMTVREAFEVSVLTRIPEDLGGNNLRKAMVDMVNVEIGYLQKRVLTNDIFGGLDDTPAPSQEYQLAPHQQCVLSRVWGGFFNKISVIKLLRTIPFESGFLGLKEAKDVAESLGNGLTITMTIAWNVDLKPYKEKLDNLDIRLEVLL